MQSHNVPIKETEGNYETNTGYITGVSFGVLLHWL